MCFPIFVVEDLSGLFLQLSIFLIRDSMSAEIIYGILSDFMYWLNSNILYFELAKQFQKKIYFYILFHEI